MKIVAMVPARGGSKGIPGKNIRPFCGQPLLYWVCKAAEDCSLIQATYVSTDDEAIAAAARAMGLSKVQVVGRASDTATDAASTESAMLDFAGRVDFDCVALLQATSPLLRAEDLEKACHLILSREYDSVLSVVRQTRFRWAPNDDGSVSPENYDPLTRPLRQECEGFLVENGACYVTSREALLEHRCRISGRVGAVEMPEDTYFELDELADWTIIEGLLLRRFQVARGPLNDRLRGVRLVATDVDGCLTDSGMYYGEHGDELKKFSTRDGQGFRLLRAAGLQTAFITAENTDLVARRAAKLEVDHTLQGIADKVAAMDGLLAKTGLGWEDVAYLGDDLGDWELLRRVGVSACPADAVGRVRGVVDMVLDAKGGAGAFRELTDLILGVQAEC